jgi:hypothetical protein
MLATRGAERRRIELLRVAPNGFQNRGRHRIGWPLHMVRDRIGRKVGDSNPGGALAPYTASKGAPRPAGHLPDAERQGLEPRTRCRATRFRGALLVQPDPLPGRDGRIRTCDHAAPNRARYLTAPHPGVHRCGRDGTRTRGPRCDRAVSTPAAPHDLAYPRRESNSHATAS